jgi:uncharacterized protein
MAEHASYHEPIEWLTQGSIERHRAIVSLMEELEAIDWYDQRVDATGDDSLRVVLAHNRDEEKEHAAMTLEWLRRNDPGWDRVLRTYLFTEEAITEVEAEAESEERSGTLASGTLAIGSLRGEPTR